MITLADFMELDGMYYVAHIYDTDGDGWVTEQEAKELLKIVNQ